jgi:streptogramin lyase
MRRLVLLAAVIVVGGCDGSPVVRGGRDAAPDVAPPPPPPPPDARVCNAAVDCNDNIPCTEDTCNPAGGCDHRPVDSLCPADTVDCTVAQCQVGRGCEQLPDDTRCAAGQFCRADVGCFERPACSSVSDPRCDDRQECTTDRCNLATGRCEYEPQDAMCSDGRFCNGEEVCTPFRGCLLRSVPSCDDGVACTLDQCNELGRRCEHFAENRLCDNRLFCDGAETCDLALGCQRGMAPNCDDGNACTVDRCDSTTNRCTSTPQDRDMDTHPDARCGGDDCDDDDPMVHPGAREVCNRRDDNCNGMVDEGVTSPCGDCDATCRRARVGNMGTSFRDTGRRGTEFNAMRGGLVVTEETTVNDFLWVPNTAESTLSRWDAAMAREIGRYRVGLPAGECNGRCCYESPCNQPSRVAVDSNGDVYVASRGFGMQGTVTKIAGDRRDCIDRNRNGMIDTSTNATPMPYGADECVLWTAPVGPVGCVLRTMVVDRGDAMFPQGYPWSGCFSGPTFYRLSPADGRILSTVPLPFSPYGAVGTADGRLWISTLDQGAMGFLNAAASPPTFGARVPYPTSLRGGCGDAYGITADRAGRIWLAGWTCRDALGFDPRSGQWTRVDTTSFVTGGTSGRGITVDATGRVYMAHATRGTDEGSGLLAWDSDLFLPGGTLSPFVVERITVPTMYSGAAGVGADRSGNIWLAHWYTSQLVRYTPRTRALSTFTGPNRVYTYSDFTGSVRRTVIGTGSYEEDFDLGCATPEFRELSWDADLPTGTSLTFVARSADTAAALASATSAPVAVAPRDSPPVNVSAALMTAGLPSRQFLRIVVTLQASDRGVSPVLRSFTLTANCR